jgi:hypothetical protein
MSYPMLYLAATADLTNSPPRAFAMTPRDTSDLAAIPRILFSAGDLMITSVVPGGASDGTRLSFRVKPGHATGTPADDIVGAC